MLLVANFSNTKMMQKNLIIDWSPDTWVLLSERVISDEYQTLDDFFFNLCVFGQK